MERLYEYARGTVRLELTGPQPEKLLNACAMNGVEFWNCEPKDDYTMRMTVYESDYAHAGRLADKNACQLKTIKASGGRTLLKKVLLRKPLLICAVILILLLMVSQLFIWDIDIEGNSQISDGEILRALEDNGVYPGVFWPTISSDMSKTGVRLQIPEIAWMAVNVRSSLAQIVIRERTAKPELYDADIPIKVVAAKTGIITQMSVEQGIAAAQPGDAVLEGESVISGVMADISEKKRTVHARGIVQARTLYEHTAVCPETESRKADRGVEHRRFALIIGQNRINFYQGSRKPYADCDKIIKIYDFAVKGVFTLPISLVSETFCRYETEPVSVLPEEGLKESLMEQLKAEMAQDGQILQSSFSEHREGGLVSVTLRAECSENIAKAVPLTQAEIDQVNFENQSLQEGKANDRTDH